VQAKRAANAVARNVRLRGSTSILTGRIYDDRGNRMSPTHSNKLGIRYRYYVSHALLQNRKQEAGSVARIPTPDIEQLLLDAIRAHLGSTEPSLPDRDLIERHLDRVIVKPQAVDVRLTVSGLRGRRNFIVTRHPGDYANINSYQPSDGNGPAFSAAIARFRTTEISYVLSLAVKKFRTVIPCRKSGTIAADRDPAWEELSGSDGDCCGRRSRRPATPAEPGDLLLGVSLAT
jgi:hypothetical protein